MTAALIISLLVLTITTRPALAERLGPQACAELRHKRDALVNKGVKDSFAKGPEWAASHLSGQKLENLKLYITYVEQLMFRCKGVKIVKYQKPWPDKVVLPIKRQSVPKKRVAIKPVRPTRKKATK